MWAAMNGRVECARLLLDAGADKEATDGVRESARVGACGGDEWRGDDADAEDGVWCGETCHLHFSFQIIYSTFFTVFDVFRARMLFANFYCFYFQAFHHLRFVSCIESIRGAATSSVEL